MKLFNLTDEVKQKLLLICLVFFIGSIFAVTPLLTGNIGLNNYRGEGTLYNGELIGMYKNPFLSLLFLIKNPLKLFSLLKVDLILLGLTAIVVAIIKNVYNTDVSIKYRENDGTYGTARWMHNAEARKIVNVAKVEPGIMFGTLPKTKERVKLPMQSYIFNKNVAVFGGPGSGKSRTYVRDNVFEMVKAKQSIIFTDPKGELFRDMFVYLKEQGYNVKVLNLVNLLNSDRWNPMTEVTDDISAQAFTEVVMANTSAPGSKGNDFWEKGEQNLLKALLLYVINEFPEEDRNLKCLYGLLSHTDAEKLDIMFKCLPEDHAAKAPYNIYCQASDTVRTGIVIGLGTRMQIIQNKKVQELTSANDIDLTAPGKELCAYFCITSDTNSTFDFLSGLFFSFLFINLINYADLHDGQCNPNVQCLLDEIANIAAIPDFIKKISTMRSRGVHTHVIFQNIGQLQNRYPDNGWSEIIGACDSKLFLGCTDLLTAQFISDLLGTTTVEDVGKSKEAGFEGVFDFGKETRKGTSRNLLNPDEVLAYPYENAILMLKGQKPLVVDKLDYENYKESKELKKIQISDYKPKWTDIFQESPIKPLVEQKYEANPTPKNTRSKDIPIVNLAKDDVKNSNEDKNLNTNMEEIDVKQKNHKIFNAMFDRTDQVEKEKPVTRKHPKVSPNNKESGNIQANFFDK